MKLVIHKYRIPALGIIQNLALFAGLLMIYVSKTHRNNLNDTLR